MQAGKNAGGSMKETVSNIAASAKSGMDKTKATVQEKVEKMTAHDPLQKEIATQKKEEKMNQAELNKLETREHNLAAKQAGKLGGTGTGTGTGTYTHSTTGAIGHSTGIHQMSALPGHGTGQPAGQVTDGVVGSHPIGTNTATGRTTAHNPLGGGGTHTGYGTGGV